MPAAGFEQEIPSSERLLIYALDRAASGICTALLLLLLLLLQEGDIRLFFAAVQFRVFL